MTAYTTGADISSSADVGRSSDTCAPSGSAQPSVQCCSLITPPTPLTAKGNLEMTPRKARLLRTVKSQAVKLCRLRKKVKTVKTVGHAIKSLSRGKKLEHIISELSEFLDGVQLQFVVAQLRSAKIAKRRRRWSDADKLLALSILYQSSKAYKFLAKIFHLPARSSLRKWIKLFETSAGFHDHVFSVLAHKLAAMRERDRLCVITFDEMSVKVGLKYIDSCDHITGFEDYGHPVGKTKNAADQALVIMVRGMTIKWKQPVGYFLSSGPTKANILQDLLLETVRRVFNAGGFVKAVICDQGSNNRSMFKGLGTSHTKPYFEYHFGEKDHSIFCYFDPPHLLKSLRNNFIKYNIEINGSLIQFAHVRKFFEMDSKLSVRMCPKLTQKHIELTNFSKMRVRLAAQIFSHSVAAGLMTYAKLGALEPSATNTANFIDRADRLFDAFNSRTLHCKLKPLKAAMSRTTMHVAFLKGCLNWFDDMKFIGSRSILPCVEGWKQSISALLGMWNDIDKNFDVGFLLTDRLNQDCIENFFAVIRQAGLCRDNPTPFEFGTAYNHAIVNILLRPPPNSNCAYDGDTVVATLNLLSASAPTPTLAKKLIVNSANADNDVCGTVGTNVPNVISALPVHNTLCYISGYVIHKIVKAGHTCNNTDNCCIDRLIEKDRSTIKSYQSLTHYKALGNAFNQSIEFGGLTLPSYELLTFISKCEDIFVEHFDGIAHLSFVRSRLNRTMLTAKDPMLCICDNLALSIVTLYNKIRLHAAVKFVNSRLNVPNAPKKNRKMLKLLHL